MGLPYTTEIIVTLIALDGRNRTMVETNNVQPLTEAEVAVAIRLLHHAL